MNCHCRLTRVRRIRTRHVLRVVQFLDCVKSPKHRTVLTTCYAAGLRISEAVRLTLPAIDSQRMVLRVEQPGMGHNTKRVEGSLCRRSTDWKRVLAACRRLPLA